MSQPQAQPSNMVCGLHHVTAVAADPQRNLDFYAGVLGLRLVKKTVNQDDPFTYHLYYGDALGRPGTAMTFFPFPGVPAGYPGRGQPLETRFAVDAAALSDWRDRLTAAGVLINESASSAQRLAFADPDGLALALVADQSGGEPTDWQPEGITSAMAIRRFAGLSLASHRPAATARVLTELLDYQVVSETTERMSLVSGGPDPSDVIELIDTPERGQPGYGTVHHIAFRVADRHHLLAMLERVQAMRLPSSGEVDRFYFRSVYFREPGGMLFEIATEEPGFTVDEPAAHLGAALQLTAEHELMRASIEATLPPLTR